MKAVRALVSGIALAVLLLHPGLAVAQRAAADSPSLTFVGAGLALGSTSDEARVRLPQESGAWSGRAEAGLAVNQVVGLGVELTAFREMVGDTSFSLGRVQITDRQREYLLVALLRAQARSGRLGFVAVAGGGLLRQHRDGSFRACDMTCVEGETAEPRRTSPAFVIGFDMPMRLAPHLDLAVAIRATSLRRGTSIEPFFAYDNSTAMAVSLTLRVAP